MRYAAFALPVLILALAGCSQNEADPEDISPGGQTSAPAETVPDSQTAPPEDRGTGLGTEFGVEGGDVTDPSTGEGTGTTQ